MNVGAGRKVHDGVGAPAAGPQHLFHLFPDGRSNGRVADVGVNFHLEITTDNHRLGFRVVDVGRDNRPPNSNFLANKFRFNSFPDGDKLHLRGDHPLLGVVHLGHWAPALAAQRVAGQTGEGLAVSFSIEGHRRSRVFFYVAPLHNPITAESRQSLAQIQAGLGIAIGTAGVINFQGRILFLPEPPRGRRQGNFAKGNPDVVPGADSIDLLASGECGLSLERQVFLNLLSHVLPPQNK